MCRWCWQYKAQLSRGKGWKREDLLEDDEGGKLPGRWGGAAHGHGSGQAALAVSGEYERYVLERGYLREWSWPSEPYVMLSAVLWGRSYLVQTLPFCHTQLPPKMTILLLAGHLRLLLPSAAMHGPPLDNGVGWMCDYVLGSDLHALTFPLVSPLILGISLSFLNFSLFICENFFIGFCEDEMR